jgi:hypothetical protein
MPRQPPGMSTKTTEEKTGYSARGVRQVPAGWGFERDCVLLQARPTRVIGGTTCGPRCGWLRLGYFQGGDVVARGPPKLGDEIFSQGIIHPTFNDQLQTPAVTQRASRQNIPFHCKWNMRCSHATLFCFCLGPSLSLASSCGGGRFARIRSICDGLDFDRK